MTRISCPHCLTPIAPDFRLSGRTVPCPNCSQHFQMPAFPPPPAIASREESDPLSFLEGGADHGGDRSFTAGASTRFAGTGGGTLRHRQSPNAALPYMIAGGVAVAILGAVALYMAMDSTTLTIANYERIKTGMTEREVENILGPGKEEASSSVDIPGSSFEVPAGPHTVHPVSIPGISASAKVMTWGDRRSRAIVVAFANGKVVSKGQFGL